MPSLLGLFDVGLSSMYAQNAGVSIAAKNVANAGTEGYSRQSVSFRSEVGTPYGGGVLTGALTRSADQLIAYRERNQAGARTRADELGGALASLESSLAPVNGGLHEKISSFFGSMSALAGSPMDSALRGQVIERASALAASFSEASAGIAQARADADGRIQTLAGSASQLANKIATLNRAIARDGDPVLQDQRELAAKQLAELTGGSARIDKDGAMRFALDNGEVLVDGGRAVTFRTERDPARGGAYALSVVDGNHVADVTGAITGGRIGAQLSFRDGTAADAQRAIDQLAYDVATQVNAVHQANAGLDGTSGRLLFDAPARVAGAASSMSVSAAVRADPRILATAAPGTGPGDTTGLQSLIALGTSPLAGGGTRSFTDEAIGIVSSVGTAHANAISDLELETARSDFLDGLRSALSGVSTEEELARISQFQHAAEAAHRFIGTVNEMLSDLIRMV